VCLLRPPSISAQALLLPAPPQPTQADGTVAFKGYNTDWAAAIGAIEQQLRASLGAAAAAASDQSPLAGKSVLVVGAGGAGRALAFGAASKWVHRPGNRPLHAGDCGRSCKSKSDVFLLGPDFLCILPNAKHEGGVKQSVAVLLKSPMPELP